MLEAEDGDSAITVLGQSDDVDLLFTDVFLPGSLNGAALAESAQQNHPELKVLFTSGHPDQAGIDDGAGLLAKPYERALLARTVHDALKV